MKQMAYLLILSLMTTLSQSAFAAGPDAGHGDAKAHRDNTTLFPPRVADGTMATAPEKPELLEPAFQAKVEGTSTNLTWKESAGADVYHVQVATDPNFKWLVKEDRNVKGSSFTADGLQAGKTYFWRVAPWKNGNMAATNKGRFSQSVFETR
jgi:hypothetical protein